MLKNTLSIIGEPRSDGLVAPLKSMFAWKFRDKNTQGKTAGKTNISNIWKKTTKFIGLNLVVKSNLKFQAKSEHP